MSVLTSNCAYTATHVATGMFYIGSTNDFERRKYDHYKALRSSTHRNPMMQYNYDWDPLFTWATFPTDDIESARVLERKMIQDNDTNSLLMNTVGRSLTDEARKAKSDEWSDEMKLAASQRAKIQRAGWSDEQKLAHANASRIQKLGSTLSEETKKKISEARSGVPKSISHREKILEKCARQVSIDDVIYPSLAEASRVKNVTLQTVKNRCRNKKFIHWRFIPSQ